jgi:MOSC domain-containing protein YiiM
LLGSVLDLYIAPPKSSGVRVEQESIELVANSGVVGDKFANKDNQKSVMIVGTKPYQMAMAEGIDLPYSALGENILLNFDPHTLNIGDRLLIGKAILEITQNCTLCKHLSRYSSRLPKLIVAHRGVYCRVVEGGVVTKNSKVELIKREASA